MRGKVTEIPEIDRSSCVVTAPVGTAVAAAEAVAARGVP